MLYVAGQPLLAYVISQGKMIVVKGSPEYLGEQYSQVLKLELMKNSDLDLSEIQAPVLGTQYGVLRSENIHLEVPLIYGDDDNSLSLGAGQYPGSALPGQGKPILISGHDSTFFAPLELIAVGDLLNITTDYGSFDYEITGTKITDDKDTSAYDLLQNEEQLILYTCYPFGQLIGNGDGRFFIYGKAIAKK